jgi:hypothetical protein
VQPEILLTLSAGSARPLLAARDPRCKDLFSLPAFAATDLELRGLNLPTDLLKGFGIPELDRLRDEADRAHCPVLLLSEENAIDFVDRGRGWAASLDRLRRLGLAASRLGCPNIALRIAAPDTDEAFEETAKGVRIALRELDRFELSVLIAPREGLTFDATRLTELIKKIGGFRIGSYPSFAHAHATGDLEKTLRKLAPYAQSIEASVRGFSEDGTHDGFSLQECLESILSVGYGNTLALEFVGKDAPGGAETAKPSRGRGGARKTAASTPEVDLVEVLDRARQQLSGGDLDLDLDDDLDADLAGELGKVLGLGKGFDEEEAE